jgi:MFS family permease
MRLAVVLFFLFILLHQTDKLLIGPLTSDIIDTFHITYTQMGAVTSGALIVGAVLYPIWGYLYDRYARNKLLALASTIWGVTTWLGALAPTYPLFVASRASTGIDDSSYPGVYSLISDYFKPDVRGKIYGLLQLAQPIGYLLGLILALTLGGLIGWRAVFFITGSLGLVLAVGIYFGVPNVPRGEAEPEMQGLEVEAGTFKISREAVLNLLKKRSLVLLFFQGFFGVFPWNVITYWIFAYLENERGYTESNILLVMVPAVLVLASGYPIGGALGDFLFKRNRRGRLIVATIGVFMGAILLVLALNVPVQDSTLFLIFFLLTAVFMPWPSPNVLSTVQDVALPEVRSTATAMFNFMDSAGSALAPLLGGIIADAYNLQTAILSISVVAWSVCVVFLLAAMVFLPGDIHTLRLQMQQRADSLRAAAETSASGGD